MRLRIPWQHAGTRSCLLFVNFFLILLAYYQVKPASRSVYLEHASADTLPYVWTASGLLLLVLVPPYQRLLSRFGRINVVLGTCATVVGLLIGFRVLLADAGLASAVGFYILVDIFSVVLVEQFWSLTNSVYDGREGRRWYGLIASGGLVGGLVGGFAASALVAHTPLQTHDLLLVAALLITLMMGLTLALSRRGVYTALPAAPAPDALLPAAAVWRSLRSNRLLALIALLLLFSQVCEPIVEYQFMQIVQAEHTEREARTVFLSNFLSLLSGVALLVNLSVTPVVHRYAGVIGGLLVQPLLLGMSAIAYVMHGSLRTAAAMKIADRSLAYSVNRASRELLYVSADADTIFRAKAWIDMVGYRVFKIAGNLLIVVLTQWVPSALGPAGLSLVVLVLCGAWFAAVLGLKRFLPEDDEELRPATDAA